VLLCHVAEAGVDERIREIGNAGEIERHRLQAVPDAFDLEWAELVPKVAVGEEIAEFNRRIRKPSGIRVSWEWCVAW
jgi:hypothetical protein